MQFQKTYTLAQLAHHLQGTCSEGDALHFKGVAALKDATADDISFLTQAHYVPFLAQTQAGAVVLSEKYADQCKIPAIIVDDPHVAFAKLMQLCAPIETERSGMHPTATVALSASVAQTAFIDAQAYIGENAIIDDYAHIGPGVTIGANSHIGAHTRLYANVNIYHEVHIGQRCIIHSGAVIGADGFGFANDKGRWVKIPQLAGVEIADDVEIGAQTAIDRGVLSSTQIGPGVKIDNLVQIGHNVHIGAHTIITGCVAIAGSTTIGKHCAIGGGSCINGHIHITDGVQITAMSGILGSIEKPGIYSGAPAIENNLWRKIMVSYIRLPEMLKRLKALENKN